MTDWLTGLCRESGAPETGARGDFDPETGVYYAVAHTPPRIVRISKSDDPESEMEYWADRDWSRDGIDEPAIDGVPITKPLLLIGEGGNVFGGI